MKAILEPEDDFGVLVLLEEDPEVVAAVLPVWLRMPSCEAPKAEACEAAAG